MHRVRWLLAIGWLTLIASMFYDPITTLFTDPSNLSSPFHVKLDQCIKIRDTCLPQEEFSMSALIWWAMIVPAGILILMTFGHEAWRRICPLSFFSQIPRALGIQRKRKVVDPLTQEARYELVIIGENSWLGKNHLYVQFGLFVLGLGLRILLVNGDRTALGYFLLATILSAILVGYLYAGKSWCQYFCPMAPVQMVYTGPRSLLGSKANMTPGITQSMCRTVDPKTGKELSACVGCKMPCIDIDSEKTYWQELKKPGRRLVQYGYLGMVIGFYLYYFLYAGNWDYYFTGAWTHERGVMQKMADPGFYLYGQTLGIPKYVAVFITYAVLVAITYAWGVILEKLYRRYTVWRGQPASAEQVQHVIFTVFTTVSFWTFFSYGARPSLNRLPDYAVLAFNALVVLVGAIWIYRTLGRTHAQYDRENMAISLRKQLHQFPIDPALLDGRSLDELSSSEVYTLVKVLLGVSQQLRLQTYTGVVQDLLTQQVTDASQSFEFCRKLRQDLQIQDTDHFTAIQNIAATHPEILVTSAARLATAGQDSETLARTVAKPLPKAISKPNRKIGRAITPAKWRR
ncbi:MAG TPA: 4Fe-4S binding protein [Coleofasciculaceae cyanobacterium]